MAGNVQQKAVFCTFAVAHSLRPKKFLVFRISTPASSRRGSHRWQPNELLGSSVIATGMPCRIGLQKLIGRSVVKRLTAARLSALRRSEVALVLALKLLCNFFRSLHVEPGGGLFPEGCAPANSLALTRFEIRLCDSIAACGLAGSLKFKSPSGLPANRTSVGQVQLSRSHLMKPAQIGWTCMFMSACQCRLDPPTIARKVSRMKSL